MYRHVYEAMLLNQLRKPLYAELTNGRSLMVSETLIAFEKDLILKSRMADLAALPFQWAGVQIVCEDYISMNEAPVFRTHYSQGPPRLEDFIPVKVSSVKDSLQVLLDAGDFKSVEIVANDRVLALEAEPRFNCMMRHFLESIRRVAGLASIHNEKAREKLGVGSVYLSKMMVKGHLRVLDKASALDRLAAPLQAAGVPILCQDVPSIPAATRL